MAPSKELAVPAAMSVEKGPDNKVAAASPGHLVMGAHAFTLAALQVSSDSPMSCPAVASVRAQRVQENKEHRSRGAGVRVEASRPSPHSTRRETWQLKCGVALVPDCRLVSDASGLRAAGSRQGRLRDLQGGRGGQRGLRDARRRLPCQEGDCVNAAMGFTSRRNRRQIGRRCCAASGACDVSYQFTAETVSQRSSGFRVVGTRGGGRGGGETVLCSLLREPQMSLRCLS